jgi:hypothetical protein
MIYYARQMEKYTSPLPGVPAIESPFFARIFADPSIDDDARRIAADLAAKGYAVIDFPDPEFADKAEAIKRELHPHYDFDSWRETGHKAGISLRVQDAWEFNTQVREIACNRHILDLLGKLYGRQAWPFQTLNFPVGTQQHFHTDSVHFSSSPERFMCGVWVAMEDIDEANGPLMYFPGSHKWPIFNNEHIGRCVAQMRDTPTQAIYEAMWRELVDASGVQPEYFHARKGQALIWAANLMHGGSAQLDPTRTRWSQVTHYFFDDCSYFTPMTSDPFYGSIGFRKLTNVATGEVMAHRYAGHEVPEGFVQATDPSVRRWAPAEPFDASLYLEANPDVAAAGVNPFEHYLMHGRFEGRRLRPAD